MNNERRTIGRGAFGTVYEYRNRHGKLLAVKELAGRASDHETEQNALRKLMHTNIVRFYEHQDDYQPEDPTARLIFMEDCECGSLLSVIMDVKVVYTVANIISWAKELHEALIYIEDHGIIHHDIASKNIFLDRNYIAKIGDFGIMRMIDDPHFYPCGTPSYMAPEVQAGKALPKEHRFKCDVYGMGLVIWETMTRKPYLRLEKYGDTRNEAPTMEGLLRACIQRACTKDYLERPSASSLFDSYKRMEEKCSEKRWFEVRKSQTVLWIPTGLDCTGPVHSPDHLRVIPPLSFYMSNVDVFQESAAERSTTTSAAITPGSKLDIWLKTLELDVEFHDLILNFYQTEHNWCKSRMRRTISAKGMVMLPPDIPEFASDLPAGRFREKFWDADLDGKKINAVRSSIVKTFKADHPHSVLTARASDYDEVLSNAMEYEQEIGLFPLAPGAQYHFFKADPFLQLRWLDATLHDCAWNFALYLMGISPDACCLGWTQDWKRLTEIALKNVEAAASFGLRCKKQGTGYRPGDRPSYGDYNPWMNWSWYCWAVRLNFEAVQKCASRFDWTMVGTARPEGENLRRVLGDRLSAMSRFNSWPEIREDRILEALSCKWANQRAPPELAQLPLLYVFHPNKPPTIEGCKPWPLPQAAGPEEGRISGWTTLDPSWICSPSDGNTATTQEFIGAHSLYEKAFRYLMCWELHELHYILYLLIVDLLKEVEKRQELPAYPIFVMGNDRQFGALLALHAERSLGSYCGDRLLIGPGFKPVHIDTETLNMEAEIFDFIGDEEHCLYLLKTSRAKGLEREGGFFTGITMVNMSELTGMLQRMSNRLHAIIKFQKPLMNDDGPARQGSMSI